MFKRKRLLGGLALIILIPIVALAWWLLSPLIIDKTVEEEFPFASNATIPQGMTTAAADQIMSSMAKLADEVNEPLPESSGAQSAVSSTIDPQMARKMADAALEAIAATMDQVMPADLPQPAKDAMHDAIENRLPQALGQALAEAAKDVQPVQISPVKLKTGNFSGADRLHQGGGQASIYRLPDGAHLLRLEQFSVTNGPDLRVILTPASNPGGSGEVTAPGHVELGKLKGNMGNQNYPIPSDADVTVFRSVVIYCKPFRVVFSVALLENVN